MKQYKKIYSFGCSFTEGGGLNNQNFHRYLSGDNNYSDKPENVLPEHTEYAYTQSYPGQLSKLLNCEVENYGTSRAANELIFNMAYDKINELVDKENILVTIQTTLLSRILLQVPYQGKSITVNNFTGIEGSVKTFYELYVCEFFDFDYAHKKIIQQVDAYNAWFNQKNVDVVWLIYEMDLEKFPVDKPFIVNFDGLDLMRFVHNHKLTITDLPNFPYKDSHFSPEGHKVIANKIFEHLKKYD
jgi:hypothetical protein